MTRKASNAVLKQQLLASLDKHEQVNRCEQNEV
jgi:hypothetical protein